MLLPANIGHRSPPMPLFNYIYRGRQYKPLYAISIKRVEKVG